MDNICIMPLFLEFLFGSWVHAIGPLIFLSFLFSIANYILILRYIFTFLFKHYIEVLFSALMYLISKNFFFLSAGWVFSPYRLVIMSCSQYHPLSFWLYYWWYSLFYFSWSFSLSAYVSDFYYKCFPQFSNHWVFVHI